MSRTRKKQTHIIGFKNRNFSQEREDERFNLRERLEDEYKKRKLQFFNYQLKIQSKPTLLRDQLDKLYEENRRERIRERIERRRG